MAMSTFQKVTLSTCLLLCVALLLPKMLLSRGRKDAADRPEGHLPPMMHRQLAPEARAQRPASSSYSRPHNSEAVARTKGAGTGAGTGGKSNLAGQIIPVYGFGILLYILYILFKITSKGSSKPAESRFPSVRSENMKRKITDFELAQLQEKLQETELMMENIVSNVHHSPDRVKGVIADQEESLLQQLTEITRVMQEGKMVDDVAPPKKNQEDWEEPADYREEPQQFWDQSHCCCQHDEPHHSPHTEKDAERTQADGADLENMTEDAAGGGGEVEEDAVRESDLKLVLEVVEPESDLSVNDGEDVHEHKEEGGHIDLGVAEEDLPGVLQELEISLKMTSVMEQEKMEDLSKSTEADTSCSSVRRRNRRRRAKKASH